MATRILIVDDHHLVRRALAQVILRTPSLEVVGEASDGDAGVRQCRELAPDGVLMDVVLPGQDGADTTREILVDQPDIRVIGLSGYGHSAHVTKMLRAGAAGYLLKTCGSAELAAAIEKVMAGEVFLGSGVTRVIPGAASDVLSPRELDVLATIACGSSTREIALQLGVGMKTVETHRRNIMSKLELRSIAELTKYALREGITPLDS